MTPARLLIIDDHDVVREALEARLREAAELEVVGCTGCWRTGLRDAVKLKPDVVLLETKRADGQGLDALRRLTQECPTTSVIVLTSYQTLQSKRQPSTLAPGTTSSRTSTPPSWCARFRQPCARKL